jgi:hypothetical protein
MVLSNNNNYKSMELPTQRARAGKKESLKFKWPMVLP